MHARPMVDREPFLEDDGTPDSASRVPDIGDMDLMTVNRILYQVEESDLTFVDGAPCSSRAYLVYYLKFHKFSSVFPESEPWPDTLTAYD